MWRSIVRARRLSYDQATNIGLAINNRHRIDPPLPKNYFRNSISVIKATTVVGELLEHSLGRAALLVHQAVANHNNEAICDSLKGWHKSPVFYNLGMMASSFSALITHSPRFDFYGVRFGFGKPLTVRSGFSNKYSGNLNILPGHEGGGSTDLEIRVVCFNFKLQRMH
ncbi:hypothetical protein Cgig2_014976 [Carnegiea gigantea]|uniref:Uncharacterized protein n=1 Tax=Carnegiea gigantea TaxID=171969 RepID=A0A9Q1Q805_9CARY|nr:hypothetical protein Cgig2_014976 [Carnegiea gigantea]